MSGDLTGLCLCISSLFLYHKLFLVIKKIQVALKLVCKVPDKSLSSTVAVSEVNTSK